MVERGCSTPNMDSHIYALKNFYDMNDIEDIRWRKLKRFRGEETEPHESRRYYARRDSSTAQHLRT